MTTTDRAWEVIRRAADRVESLALHAAIGPWESGERCVWNGGTGAVVSDGSEGDGGCFDEGTAAWIAALSPAVAEPLVAWLRAAADSMELHVPIWEEPEPGVRPRRTHGEVDRMIGHHFGHALTFSRRVLGEAS
jgi:hypothetical protein